VRVVGGRFGGRPLIAPRGRATRPTPERVREALFSILGPVEDLRVLDLFAGSGALGLEALSRGAAFVTLVDSSEAAARAIRRNVGALGVEAELRRQTVSSFLQQARQAGRQYDLVFLDPPYGEAPKLGPGLSAALVPVLAPSARVIGESDRRAPLELNLLTPRDERRYGDTLIRIYSHDPPETPVALGSDVPAR
jgi:16S rRNA (guanine966-N2)-methyltransferase